MNKLFSFMAGAMCGALIGGVTALLLTPQSGADLKSGAQTRWQLAMDDARMAMAETQAELEAQFERAKHGNM